MARPKLTKDQAQILIDAHDVMQLMENEEEMELLEEHNPELLLAYNALLDIANT